MSGLPHGGNIEAFGETYPHATTPLIDLSTGINPQPYVPVIDPAWMARLPGAGEEEACAAAFANYAGIDPAYVQVTPGSQAIISSLPYLFDPTRVAVLAPTYGEHAASWRTMGHSLSLWTKSEIFDADAEIIVLTNPNNPDGHVFDTVRLIALQKKQRDRGGWLIIDEAFVDCAPELSVAANVEEGGLLVLHSFGKFFGLAGLRLGFLIGPREMASRLTERWGPWSVSTAALHIGQQAYADVSWIESTRSRLTGDMERLTQLVFPKLGTAIGGTSLFCLADVLNAREAADHLGAHGIYVRTFADMPNYFRIGLPGEAWQWERLETALSDWK